jgi:GT2 family glycosyltransferase
MTYKPGVATEEQSRDNNGVTIQEPSVPRSTVVSVIVLNYNGKKYLEDCVSSVLESLYTSYELILVDNDSSDGTADYMLREYTHDTRIVLKFSSRNLGFAAGNNLGAKIAKGKYLIFLNNDTMVKPTWMTQLVVAMETDVTVGACQSKILYLDDPSRIDSMGGLIYKFGFGHEIGSNQVDKGQFDYLRDIFFAKGASLCVRRTIFESLGGFDETMFLRSEDVDLCWRIRQLGYRVVVVPKSIVLHKKGASVREGSPLEVYFSARNRSYVMLKNCSIEFLTLYFPQLLLAEVYMSVGFLQKRQLSNLFAQLKGVIWNLVNFGIVLQVRRSRREMRDSEKIVEKQLVKTSLATFLRLGDSSSRSSKR